MLNREIRHTDVPDAPFLLELRKRRPALFDVLVGDRPMNLIQIDRIDGQPLEARFQLPPNRGSLKVAHDLAVRIDDTRCLREDVRSGLDTLKRGGNDTFGAAESVDGRGVDPVHPKLERAMDSRDRVTV